MQKKYNIIKITDYLYDNGLNVTGRVKSYPQNDEKIIKEPTYTIDRINVGADGIDGKYYIRVSFRGSAKWYSVPIKEGQEDIWWDRTKFVISQLIDDIDDFSDEQVENEKPDIGFNELEDDLPKEEDEELPKEEVKSKPKAEDVW